eukprot:jgi/Bigna1/64626/fgenesh1_kg.80_\
MASCSPGRKPPPVNTLMKNVGNSPRNLPGSPLARSSLFRGSHFDARTSGLDARKARRVEIIVVP